MTPVRGLVVVLLGVTILAVPPSPSGADPDTWSGTWTVTAQGTGTLTLQQDSSGVSGVLGVGGSSAGLSSASVSGSTLDADFGGNGLNGHLNVTLSGTTFAGTYTASLLGVTASGAISGTCVAGPCLSNGGGSPSPGSSGNPGGSGTANPPSSTTTTEPSVELDPVQAEQHILDALAAGSLAGLPELPVRDDEFGNSLASAFYATARMPPDDATETLLRITGELMAAEDHNGVPLYPSITAMAPVILRMAAHGSSDPDPQARQSFATATVRLVAFLVKYDTAFDAGGSSSQPAQAS